MDELDKRNKYSEYRNDLVKMKIRMAPNMYALFDRSMLIQFQGSLLTNAAIQQNTIYEVVLDFK